MRPIKKLATGTYQLTRANLTPPTTRDEATHRWASLKYKSELKDYLILEQYGLCCYAEIRPDELGLGFHIEHVENKSQNPARTFDYTNLAASSLDSKNDLSAFKSNNAEVFGGHASGKSKGVDLKKFISSHDPDCSRFFAYLSDGRIVPADNLMPEEAHKATYTLELLNLNSPYLISLRLQWWDELAELIEEHIEDDMSLTDLAAIDLTPINDRLSRFYSMTRQMFGKIAFTL
ncbi:retron system putative HNH endonuclease [Pseudomonas sp.]|uniref:retron system putative HNH endonuclease n=1 Tax=Pseudomonas sp. TaxID=306 RepID=UPI0028A8017E|nr:retron system putative HNH endonuclease [Pseudomonas sp.]